MFRHKLHVLGACVLSVGVASAATPAAAADLWGQERYGSIKDAPIEPVFTWAGFYAGIAAGLATGDLDEHVVDDDPVVEGILSSSFDVNGPIYGGHLGYNYQSGSWVVGIEGTFSGTDIDGDASCVFGLLVCRSDIDWIGTVEGRLGYGFGRSLVYVRGGVAWADVSTNADLVVPGIFSVSSSETHTGWTAGIGFEHAMSPNVIARIEYSHIDLGNERHDLKGTVDFGQPTPVGPIPLDVDMEIDTIKVGVSFKFNGTQF